MIAARMHATPSFQIIVSLSYVSIVRRNRDETNGTPANNASYFSTTFYPVMAQIKQDDVV